MLSLTLIQPTSLLTLPNEWRRWYAIESFTISPFTDRCPTTPPDRFGEVLTNHLLDAASWQSAGGDERAPIAWHAGAAHARSHVLAPHAPACRWPAGQRPAKEPGRPASCGHAEAELSPINSRLHDITPVGRLRSPPCSGGSTCSNGSVVSIHDSPKSPSARPRRCTNS